MATRTRLKMDRYVQLVREFPLVPIESEAQLDRAIAVIDSLIEKDRTPEEEAYLDVLSTVVEAYEEDAHPIEPASDAAVLSDLLESRGITQAQLARETAIAESTVSAVLNSARRLTREQVGRVASFFRVPPGVFHFGE